MSNAREANGEPISAAEQGSRAGADGRIADRIAAAFQEHGARRFRLARRVTRIKNGENGSVYEPELVLFDGGLIHTIVELDASDDRGDWYSRRADCYRAIPSLQNYMIVRTEQPRITWFTRIDGRRWLFGAADDIGASARLETPAVMLHLDEVYEGVLAAEERSA